MGWLIYNQQKGYMCEDEDRSDGIGYDFIIDEYTIIFESEENAKLNCSRGDVVVARSAIESSEKTLSPKGGGRICSLPKKKP